MKFARLSKRVWIQRIFHFSVLGSVLYFPSDIFSSDFNTLYQEGLAAKQGGRHDEAVAKFRAAVALDPQNAEALFQLGTVLSWTKQYDEALRFLTKATAISPEDMDIYLGIARVKSWKGDLDGARTDLEAILVKHPEHTEARSTLGRIFIWQKEYARAEVEFRQVLKLIPESKGLYSEALQALGDIMYSQKKYREAYGFYEQAEAIDPQSSSVRNKLQQLNRYAKVLGLKPSQKKSTPSSPEHTEPVPSHPPSGTEPHPQKPVATADPISQKPTEPPPVETEIQPPPPHLPAADFERFYLEGMAAKQAGRYDEAISKLRQALALDPLDRNVFTELVTVLGWAQRYDEALKLFSEAMEVAPDDMDIRLGASRVKAWAGDLKGAKADLESILAREPDHLDARFNLGRLLFWQKDGAGAEAELQRVLNAAPKGKGLYLDTLLTLGDMRLSQEKYREAREFYHQAQAIDPQSSEIPIRLEQAKDPPQWRFDTGYAYNTFAEQSRWDWHEYYMNLNYSWNRKTFLNLHSDTAYRFGLVDETVEVGMDQRFTKGFSGYVTLGATPEAHFSPDMKVTTGGILLLSKGGKIIGPTLLTFDYRYAVYNGEEALVFVPGLQQYLTDRVWLTGKWYHGINLVGQDTDGFLARVDWLVVNSFTLYGGMAESKESMTSATALDLSREVPTHTYFGGGIWEITPNLGIRVDYSHEILQKIYVRRSVNIGTFIRF